MGMLIFLLILVWCHSLVRGLKVVLHSDYGSSSHVVPLLEVGSVLKGRNHTVIYAAAESKVRDNKGYGFEFRSLGTTFDDASFRDAMKRVFGQRKKVNGGDIFSTFDHILFTSYEAVYPRLAEVVEQETPDVLVCDFFSPACRDVGEMVGIPLVVSFQSSDGFSLSRAPFITDALDYISITTDNLGFVDRFHDKVVVPLVSSYKLYWLKRGLNKKRAVFNVPAASHPLGDFTHVLGLANTFIGFEAASPLAPNLRMIGPLKTKEVTPLSRELESFLDKHSRVMYIGFGSRVALAGFDVENLIVASLVGLEEGIIDGVVWGLGSTNQEDFPEVVALNNLTRESLFLNHHPDMRILPWAPQDAILNHKNTKLFISHGGLGSLFEAIFSTTPVLCMPFFSDQPRNARKLEDAGIGQYVDRISATPRSLANQMAAMLQDGNVAMNLRRMQVLAKFGSRRKELGADAIEEYAYAAHFCRLHQKHVYGQTPCEAKHLIPASHKMSYIKANLIDIYLAAAAFTLVSGLVLMYSLLKLYPHLWALRKYKTKPKTQ